MQFMQRAGQVNEGLLKTVVAKCPDSTPSLACLEEAVSVLDQRRHICPLEYSEDARQKWIGGEALALFALPAAWRKT